MTKVKYIFLLRNELTKAKDIIDNMMYSIIHDSDFPLETDTKDGLRLEEYAKNIKLLLTEEIKKVK